ncbi:MAG: hypothetical protein PQJ60_10755 [Spirochaetales bacterium]|nr:hypothetical protein [Spirochaetales bacterium]
MSKDFLNGGDTFFLKNRHYQAPSNIRGTSLAETICNLEGSLEALRRSFLDKRNSLVESILCDYIKSRGLTLKDIIKHGRAEVKPKFVTYFFKEEMILRMQRSIEPISANRDDLSYCYEASFKFISFRDIENGRDPRELEEG